MRNSAGGRSRCQSSPTAPSAAKSPPMTRSLGSEEGIGVAEGAEQVGPALAELRSHLGPELGDPLQVGLHVVAQRPRRIGVAQLHWEMGAQRLKAAVHLGADGARGGADLGVLGP